jgi:hypothetical protein
MRKIILAALAAASIFASTSAFAGYWVATPYGPVYQPTCSMVLTAYGWVEVCG